MIRTRATLLGALADRQSAGSSGARISQGTRLQPRADEGPLTEERGESPDPPKPTPRPRPPRPGIRERGKSGIRRYASVGQGEVAKERGESPTPPETKER